MQSTGCTLFWVSLLFFGSVCPEKLPMHIMCPCYPVGGQQSLLPFILVLLCPALAICALFILSPMLVLQISTPIWAKRIKFISKSRINTSRRGFYHQVEKSPHLIIKCLLSSVKFTKRFEWRLSCTEDLPSEKLKQNRNSKISNCCEELKNSLLSESTVWKWQLAILLPSLTWKNIHVAICKDCSQGMQREAE